MKYRRILAIGDIHGMYDKLITLIDKIQFNPKKDLLIFLGDYIDRGYASIRSLLYVMDLKKKFSNNVICLMGNHEWLFYHSFAEDFKKLLPMNDVSAVWVQNGGVSTYSEFIVLPDKKRTEILQWVGALPLQYEIGDYYFCHAGVHPFCSLDDQKEKDLLWIREMFFEEYDGNKTIVVGHTPTQKVWRYFIDNEEDKNKPIFTKNHIILCDTGVYKTNGKLSCVDVISKKFWQV